MSEQERNASKKVIAHAPAKVNLALLVEPPNEGDEKHYLNSVFCTLSFNDTLVFDFVSGSEPFNAQVSIESLDFDTSYIKPHDNTLTKTVEHFKREYGFGFLPTGTLHVQLIKAIPTQAGLGGGSSDGAAMLRMLCWLAQVDPLSEKSLAVARAVGADVPFFLYAPKTGFCAHMKGYGDTLVQVVPKPELSIALVKPSKGVSTSKAYAAFDAEHSDGSSSGCSDGASGDASNDTTVRASDEAVQDLISALVAQENPRNIASLCFNNMEQAAFSLLPPLAPLKEEVCSLAGVLGVTLAGSGSTLFAICEDAQAARACIEYAASKDLWAVATHT